MPAPKTRAKMRCSAINTVKSTAIDPELRDVYEAEGYDAALAKAQEADPDRKTPHIEFDQPTITLTAVTGEGSEENKHFWSATPSGSVTLTISNPDAAETFDLGAYYYVDFQKVPEKK